MKEKLYILTEEEFREIFNLDQQTRIPKYTLKQYSLYIKGSYLMFMELYNMNKKKPFTINFREENVKIVCDVHDRYNWQKFVNPLGTVMKLSCLYISKGGRDGRTPFWTHTKFGNDVKKVANIAYNQLNNQLMRMSSVYSNKYLITLQWRCMFSKYGDLREPVWLDGCNFTNKLELKNSDGTYSYIGDYNIKQSITNRFNVFEGRILNPVQKIIDSLGLDSSY